MGDWTQAVLDRAPRIEHIYCWEPGAEALPTIRHRLGDDDAVTLMESAVADRDDWSRAFFHEPLATQAASLFLDPGQRNVVAQTVQVVTVDTEMARLAVDTVDLMKVDAEGADFLVLQGARESLRSQKLKLIQFEYHRPWLTAGATLRAALKFLDGCGYDTNLLNGRGLCRFDAARAPEIFHYMNFAAVARLYPISCEIQPDPLWG